jgi:hypothetical protein
MKDEEIGIAEASERSSVSRIKLVNACESGKLRYRVLHGRRRVRMEDVVTYAETVPPPLSREDRLRGLRGMMRISEQGGEK